MYKTIFKEQEVHLSAILDAGPALVTWRDDLRPGHSTHAHPSPVPTEERGALKPQTNQFL